MHQGGAKFGAFHQMDFPADDFTAVDVHDHVQIKEAIKLIDPEGMLVPVTRQYDRIWDMLEIATIYGKAQKKGRASKRLCRCGPVQDLLFVG